MPTAIPLVTEMAGPVWALSASERTGPYLAEVKYSLVNPTMMPENSPARMAQKGPSFP